MSDFPGILIVETLHGPTVYISDVNGDICSWTHAEIAQNPKLYVQCLNIIMNAAKQGPAMIREILKNPVVSEEKLPPDGKKLCCIVCSKEFLIKNPIYRTSSNFNEKVVWEYQCSEKCYESRKSKLNGKEGRNGFIRKLQELYKKPV